MATSVQGLPPGATVKPIAGASTPVEGLPPGASVKQFGGDQSQSQTDTTQQGANDPGVARGIWETTGQSVADLGKAIYDTNIDPLVHPDQAKEKHEANRKILYGLIKDRKFGDAALHIYNTAKDDSVGIQLAHGILSSHVDQAKKTYDLAQQAYEAHKAGNFQEAQRLLLEATGHGLATITPVVGPAAAKAGEDIGAGKTGEGIGEGIGLIGSMVAPHVVGKVGGKVAKTLESVKPGETTIAGETIPKLASQEKGATPAARRAAQIENEPAIQAKQQAGSQKAVKNIAGDAVDRATKRFEKPAYRVRDVGEEGITANGSHAHATVSPEEAATYREGRATAQGKPQEVVKVDLNKLKPEDYEIKKGPNGNDWVRFKNDIPEESVIRDGAGSKATADSFGHAADQVREAAKPVYDQINKASDGKFSELMKQRKAAYNADDFEKVRESEKAIDELFEGSKEVKASKILDNNGKPLTTETETSPIEGVTKKDYENAKAAWSDSKVLDRVHAAVDRAFNGVPEDVAGRTGIDRTLKGGPLKTKMGNLLRDMKPAEVERVIGKEGVDNLYRIADLLDKPETAGNFRTAVENVARYMGRKTVATAVGAAVGHATGAGGTVGAAGGAVIHEAMRGVMHSAAVNGRVGKMFADAVKVGATPKVYAPLIAAEIGQQNKTEQDKKKKE